MRFGIDVEENMHAWNYFESKWEQYLEKRTILDGNSEPQFPEFYDVNERDIFYGEMGFDGHGGASGHDAPMIAYGALLDSGSNWEELCNRAMFHSGDSDSTGVIARGLYGAMFGYHGVAEVNYKELEYID